MRGMQTSKTLGPMRDAVEIVRGVLGGEPFEYTGDTWSASVPALEAKRTRRASVPPVYVAATAPKMQALAGEIADGCLTPSITTPAFVRYTRENVDADIDIGCTVVASIHAHRSRLPAGTARARSPACISPTRCRTSRARPTRCSSSPASSRTRSVRSPRRWSRAAVSRPRRMVSDALLDKCRPIAGTPDDCIAAIEEYRDAGCTHVMLELWGADRHEQIRLFGERCCRTSDRDGRGEGRGASVRVDVTASSTRRAA